MSENEKFVLSVKCLQDQQPDSFKITIMDVNAVPLDPDIQLLIQYAKDENMAVATYTHS